MYENHRDNFGRRDRPRDEQSRGSGRDGRDWNDQAWGDGNYRGDEDRSWRSEQRGPGYGSGSWADQSSQRDGGYRERHSHDDHPSHAEHRSSYDRTGYGRSDDNRQQPYFTGAQNSWAVPPQTGAYGGSGSYGGSGNYGRDYRDHGYGCSDERGFFAKAGDEVASWFGDEDAARRREADHRGRGPKDYVRSDERIREDANDRLTEDRRVDASNVTVTVEKGEVTLGGTVPARDAKRRAEDIVEHISGVKHVQNNLRVAETTATGTTDGSWALNQRSTAEGGTLGKETAPAKL